jgi:hypothetical protein
MLNLASVDKCHSLIYIAAAAAKSRPLGRFIVLRVTSGHWRLLFLRKMISMQFPSVLQLAAMRFCSATIVYDERVCKFISSSAARPASP